MKETFNYLRTLTNGMIVFLTIAAVVLILGVCAFMGIGAEQLAAAIASQR